MSKRPGCEARQVSDQMNCARCGLVWDMDDPDQPECRIKQAAEASLQAVRGALVPKPADAALLVLQETPLRWLPTCGVRPCLVKINWLSQPEARYVAIRRPLEHSRGMSRVYTFYGDTGSELFEVLVTDSEGQRTAKIRRGGLVNDL